MGGCLGNLPIGVIMDKLIERLTDTEVWQRIFDKYDLKSLPAEIVYAYTFPNERRELAERIVSGSYTWSIPRVGYVPKDDGTKREVIILDGEDRIVMALLTDMAYIDFIKCVHPNCVSYQRGLGVAKVLHKLKLRELSGYKVDLKKYFDNVPYHIIEKCIRDMYGPSPITELLLRFYKDNRVIKDGVVVEKFRSICQGCSFSSVLANLILRNVDEKMSNLYETYLRYSDDILMLGDEPEMYLATLTYELSRLGLELNPKKVERINGEFTFLGAKVGRDYVHWSEKTRNKLKSIVRNMCRQAKGSSIQTRQRNAIRCIQYRLFEESKGHSYFEWLASLATDSTDTIWLSKYCKDEIRAMATGCHNFTKNRNKTTDEMLKELGWVNLDYVYRVYKTSTAAYKVLVKHILTKTVSTSVESISAVAAADISHTAEDIQVDLKNGILKADGRMYKVVKEENPYLFEHICELWEYAKYYKGKSPFSIVASDGIALSSSVESKVEEYHSKLLMLILISRSDISNLFINLDGFILLRDWCK